MPIQFDPYNPDTLDPAPPAQPEPEQEPAADGGWPSFVAVAATTHGVDPGLLTRQVMQESGGNANAVSPAGARGISQFMPDTAKEYGVDVNDAASSIDGQARYMKKLIGQFGDVQKATAAYNWGPGNVSKAITKYGDAWLDHAPAETQKYVANVAGVPSAAAAPYSGDDSGNAAPRAAAKAPTPDMFNRTLPAGSPYADWIPSGYAPAEAKPESGPSYGWTDPFKLMAKGAVDTASLAPHAVEWIARKFGKEDMAAWARGGEEDASGLSDSIKRTLSPGMQKAIDNPLITDEGKFGPTPVATTLGAITESVPAMAAMYATGTGVLKGLEFVGAAGKLTRLMTANGASQEAISKAVADLASGSPIASFVKSGMSHGTAQATIMSLQTGQQIENQLAALPANDPQWDASPAFQKAYHFGTDPNLPIDKRRELARKQVAEAASDQGMARSFVLNLAIGAATGGGVFNTTARDWVTGNVAKRAVGAAVDAPILAAQSGGNQVITNLATNQPTFAGVPNAAASGAAMGATLGAGMPPHAAPRAAEKPAPINPSAGGLPPAEPGPRPPPEAPSARQASDIARKDGTSFPDQNAAETFAEGNGLLDSHQAERVADGWVLRKAGAEDVGSSASEGATAASAPPADIVTNSGKPFARPAQAMLAARAKGLEATHEPVPIGDNEWVLRPKQEAAPAVAERATAAPAEKPAAEVPAAVAEAPAAAAHEAPVASTTPPVSTEAAAKHEPASTEAQLEKPATKENILAGNAALDHRKLGPFDLSLENRAGSTRRDMHNEPPKWTTEMKADYGYAKGVKGFDKDQLDFYIKPGTPDDYKGAVFVVDQKKPGNGNFDEHKVMAGWGSAYAAKKAYMEHYEAGWKGLKAITPTTMRELKAWADRGGPQEGDFAGNAKPVGGRSPAQSANDARLSAKAHGARQVNPAKDDIVAAATKLGGFTNEHRRDITSEKDGHNPRLPFVGTLFGGERAKGLDDMATALHEHGYLSHHDMQDVDGGIGKLVDKIQATLAGNPEYSEHNTEAADRHARDMQEQYHAERLEQSGYNELAPETAHAVDAVATEDWADIGGKDMSHDDIKAWLDEGTEDAGSTAAGGAGEGEGRAAEPPVNPNGRAEAPPADESGSDHEQRTAEPGQADVGTGGHGVEAETPEKAPSKEGVSTSDGLELLALDKRTPQLDPTGQTEAEARAEAKAADVAKAKEAADVKAADEKKAADAQREGFDLTGSDRAADANKGQDSLFALDKQPAPLWRSALTEALPKAPWSKDGAIPAEQLSRWLDARSRDGTFKKDELEWSGLNDYLKLKGGKVSRDDVAAFLEQNGVKVTEKTLGEESPESKKPVTFDEAKALLDGGDAYIVNEHGGRIHADRLNLVREQQLYEVTGGKSGDTKFASYQLPGGENYRELLLTLPFVDPAKDPAYLRRLDAIKARMDAAAPGSAERAQATADYKAETTANFNSPANKAVFRSSHFEPTNILAHIRFNERTDANGGKVLFIEELQSDWAQKGRKQGFAFAPEREAALRAKIAEIEAIGKEATPAQKQEWVDAMNELQPHRQREKPPAAPFVGKTEAWVALAMKRMIRYAVDNGFDSVAWTNGEQQAARYDLSKHIESIGWTKGRGHDKENTHLLVFDHNGQRITDRSYGNAELADVIGKELADKILASPELEGGFKGLDLKVGGEGMRAFYDKIVPNVANDILKKLGGEKVGELSLGGGASVRESGWSSVETPKDVAPPSKQPGFAITDKMRETAGQGMPLFAKERGPSPEYAAAHEKANNAERAFNEVTAKYRAKAIGDDEYIAARKERDAAAAEFDKAYEAESKRKPEPRAPKPENPQGGFDFDKVTRATRAFLPDNADEPTRVAVTARVAKIAQLMDKGDVAGARMEIAKLLGDKRTQNYKREVDGIVTDRVRGVDWVRERLIRGKRNGEIEPHQASLALWLLSKNRNLANDLAITVNQKGKAGTAGQYRPAERLVTLIEGKGDPLTAAHEILHHAERMMPEKVQDGIREAWAKDLTDFQKWGAGIDSEVAARAVHDVLMMNAGDREAQKRVIDMIHNGELPHDFYPLTNPSEYWAEHGSRILNDRAMAEQSWVGSAKQWLREFIQHVKRIFGLQSDHAVIKGLESILSGTGERQTSRMMFDDPTNRGLAAARDRVYAAIDKEAQPDKEAGSGRGYSLYQGVSRPTSMKTPLGDSLLRMVAPAARGPIASLQAGIMRHNLAREVRFNLKAAEHFEKTAKLFGGMSVKDQIAFTNAYERGGVEGVDPRLQPFAADAKKFNAYLAKMVQDLGLGDLQNLQENYLGRMWKDEAAAQLVFGKRPLEGSKAFLKDRLFRYFSEGLDAGLEPLTYNPVEMLLLKGKEISRYVYGQRIWQEMKDNKLVKFVPFKGERPDGWTKVDDKVAKIYEWSEAEGGFIDRGEYYAPDQAATLINNHLGAGLQGKAVYDVIRASGNMLNAVQLGLSAFHLGFTTMDTMVSKAALGIQQVSRGHVIEGIGNVAQSVNPLQPFLNLYKGDRVFRQYFGNLNDPTLAPIVGALLEGGGRVALDPIYRNTNRNALAKALRERSVGGIAKSILPSLMDKVNWPIFEYLVPRQKLGIYFDMAHDYIKHNPDASQRERREALGKMWDSVDNRMGQLAYDNVFWNRTLKDSLMVAVRSVGWNLGTFRELGGGVKDLARAPKDLAAGKGLTSRTAYLFALPMIAGVLGSIMNYAMTGESPQEPKDMFYPRTGRKRPDGTDDRVSLPSYMKDIYGYSHDLADFGKYGSNPANTLLGKLHPLIGMVGDMFSNKDFFGGAIRSPGDPWFTQLADEAKFIAKQAMPFGVRNYQQQSKAKKEEATVAGYLTSPSMIGVTPAPGYITKSDEQIESAAISRQKDALMTKFREELADGANMAEVRQRMRSAGLRPNEVDMVVRQAQQQHHNPKLRHFAQSAP